MATKRRKIVDETWAIVDGRRVTVAVEGPEEPNDDDAAEVVARVRLTPEEAELVRRRRAQLRAKGRRGKDEREVFERAVGRLAIDAGKSLLSWVLDGDAKPEDLDK